MPVIALQSSLVPAQGLLAGGAGVGDGLHAVHTERDQAARPDPEHTEGATDDSGEGTGL